MSEEIKVLVLVTDYPMENGKVAHRFVHVRNVFYQKSGIDVTVLNFATDINYIYEGIQVISLESYQKQCSTEKYDILISHQPNLRNHYLFFKKYGDAFSKFIFFFHGHEVLSINKAYSKPYAYMKSSCLKRCAQDLYDFTKLNVWKKYLPKIAYKTKFVFVSKWMLDEFLKWTRIPFDVIKDNYSITYNGVGEIFETLKYDEQCSKEYDFVTIRSNLDGSKYCIDIVNELAKANPSKKFLVVGKGKFFEYYNKADNLFWENRSLNHSEIIEILQKAKYALMPTRTDAQGLMMCEMAAFGIPVITSDIPVCHEVFDGFDNVYFLDNKDTKKSLDSFFVKEIKCVKDDRYFVKNTVEKEVTMLKQIRER